MASSDEQDAATARAERLAAALRENLKRRKTQAKERSRGPALAAAANAPPPDAASAVAAAPSPPPSEEDKDAGQIVSPGRAR